MISKNVLKFVLSLKIRRLRQKKGLSLKDLAEKSGLSHSYLNEIEKGKKYPKVEKLLGLAQALEISIDDLVSVKMGKKLHPLLEFLESDLVANLPLDAFGIGEQDVYDLMSHAPEKFTSFLMTVSELAKSYDVSISELNKSALRAYIEVNSNYFPILEEFAELHRDRIIKSFLPEGAQLNGDHILNFRQEEKLFKSLITVIQNEYQIKVDLQTIGNYPDHLGITSVYKGKKGKTLFINPKLDRRQQIFFLAKELGAQVLGPDEDNDKGRSSANLAQLRFKDLLFDYQCRYFAEAFLIPENELVHDLQHFFKFTNFSAPVFKEIVERYQVPPEILMERLTQVLPHHFGLDQFFFLRCNENKRRAPGRYYITEELHLGKLHHPHGVSLREHYCRRWITIDLLEEAANSDTSDYFVGGQFSQMEADGDKYFALSMARKRTTDLEVNSCFTLGLAINEKFHQRINFGDDQKIEGKLVGRTCERCPLEDCAERVAPAQIYIEKLEAKQKVAAIDSILNS
ncbi:MAG: hypothetical protein CME63_01965 [Halobacteriovoraceae bacterium]|nr:hypothetical protein [Halobacteriovoraceae bacterium]